MFNIVCIFGPSCSGKSTLAQALSKELAWTYIDRDGLIETNLCTDDTANALIDKKIGELKSRIVIDAQLPWRVKKERELFCLVLPPIEILLERDAKRTINLSRDSNRADRAKKYVINTHTQLTSYPKEQFDLFLDSSRLTLDKEVEAVRSWLKTTGPIGASSS